MDKRDGKLRIGVLGLGRGGSYINLFDVNPNSKVVAVCDFDEFRIRNFKEKKKDVAVYTDYEKFLEHEMDAVVSAGYGTEHAPHVVKALKAGKHVLSEVIACKTLAEGVELCRTVEKTGKLYMFAENYCYFPYVQEMRWIYEQGMIGKYIYGECEYVHDIREYMHTLTNGPDHWRNWLPSTYYCTHSIGPVIMITGTRPVQVSGFVIPNRLGREVGRRGDDGAVLICKMDNGAITKVIPWSNLPHVSNVSIWYRIYGLKGTMENNRWKNTNTLNLFTKEKIGEKGVEKSYVPEFRKYKNEAVKYGHGGGDFFIAWEFVDAIVNKKESPIDVYKAMDMTLLGILGFRSILNNNIPIEVPDFRKESERKKYENDHWSPDPKDRHIPGQPFPSVLGDIKIPDSVYQELEEKRRMEREKQEEALKKAYKT